jgi:hypothetical protein
MSAGAMFDQFVSYCFGRSVRIVDELPKREDLVRQPFFGIILIASIMLGTPALAASKQDFQDCRDINNKPEKAIAACSRIIDDSGSNGIDPVAVGDGQFICCRAMLYDCRYKLIWAIRDIGGKTTYEQCQMCLRNLKC